MDAPPYTIMHHGAVRGVTGSCHELRLGAPEQPDAPAILIDCGVFQGAETSGEGAGSDRLAIEFPIDHVRALVLTHVHLDHVGRLPHLLAAGFDGPVYCSAPSAILLPLVIEDALRVGVTRDRTLIRRMVERLQSQLRPLPCNRWHRVDTGAATGLEIRLRRAGHILGSVYVECRVSAADGRRRRVLFSGDLGAAHTPLLPEPEAPTGCHELVIEATYGDRVHEDRAARVERLEAVIGHALRDRGTVLIPAFSIGRTQELLYEIEEIIHRRHDDEVAHDLPWNELEVVVDSPLAARFTRVYRQLKPFWDEEARERLEEGRDPLAFAQVRTVNGHEDHLRVVRHLQDTRYPAIVIAASGMCAGGRIVNYLKALLDDPATDVLFVGYQAEGTPGRAIQQYGPRGGYVELDGERVAIRAAVHTIGGYSAHADRADLLRFVGAMRRAPDTVRIVHGDPDAKRAFAATLAARLPAARIVVPGSPEDAH
ncbi:MAG: Ribonuclease [Pseudomonadales bacterium]|nr:Ribonuclease [Pseudomonadales bacterium]